MNNAIPKEYLRFNIIERTQHIILFTTFLLLSFTGWALKYPDITVEHVGWWIKMWGGAKTAGLIHRIAGITMLIDFGWHVLYLMYMLATGKMKFRMNTTIVPLPKDVLDLIKNMLYFFGVSREKPIFWKIQLYP